MTDAEIKVLEQDIWNGTPNLDQVTWTNLVLDWRTMREALGDLYKYGAFNVQLEAEEVLKRIGVLK